MIPVIILCVFAFSTHALPYSLSPYPFNNDGIYESSVAQDIIENGHMTAVDLDSGKPMHSEPTPVFNTFLAFCSATLGSDPMSSSQLLVAAISLLTVIGVYVLLRHSVGNVTASLLGGMAAVLFGTFVYLTSSVWKESLGIALYMLLLFAYSQRGNRAMYGVVIVVLAIVPFVHHLVAFVSYLTIAYITAWSMIYAVRKGRPTYRHYAEATGIVVAGCVILLYYHLVSFTRSSYLDPTTGLLPMIAIALALSLLMSMTLLRKNHWPGTFAPLVAVFVLAIVIVDYFNPLFTYSPYSPIASYVPLTISTVVLIALAWYGLEGLAESTSKYRAIPFGALLPALTLVCFALLSPSVESRHQLIYRSMDFADPAIFLGMGFGVAHLIHRKKFPNLVIAVTITALLVSFPFGIYTQELLGVRHDTQESEIDAIDWIVAADMNHDPYVQSDERVSYITRSLFGIGKDNKLPMNLVENNSLAPDVFYVYEQFWSSVGVSDYPRPFAQPSASYMRALLSVENVIYIGGSPDDQLIVFHATAIGQTASGW